MRVGELVVISLTHLDGTLLYACRSHQTVLGYTPEELVGHSIAKIVDPADLETRLQRVAQALERGETALVRGRMRRKDGSFVPVEGTVTIVNGEAEPGPFVLFTNRDLTRRSETAENTAAATSSDGPTSLSGGHAD